MLGFIHSLGFDRRQDGEDNMSRFDPFSAVSFHDFIGAVDRDRNDRRVVDVYKRQAQGGSVLDCVPNGGGDSRISAEALI